MASINTAAAADTITERLHISRGAQRLEAELAYCPDAPAGDAVLLIPPHPNFAGTMENNVLQALFTRLAAAGHAVLRFNYPGIGGSLLPGDIAESAFDYWNRLEAHRDFTVALDAARSAHAWLRRATGAARLHAAGYSYGGWIGLMLAGEHPGLRVAAISMPWIPRYSYDSLRRARGETYFIQGARDFVFDRAVFARAWPLLPEPRRMDVIDGDHFLRGMEGDAARRVDAFVRGTLAAEFPSTHFGDPS